MDYNWDVDNNYGCWGGCPDKWNYTLTDKFGIAWNDNWNAQPETAKYSYRYYGYHGSLYTDRSIGQKNEYDDYDPGSGIGWKVDLVNKFIAGDREYTVYRHKGWGQIQAVKSHNGDGTTDTSSASARYFHKVVEATSGTLTFSSSPSVSITYAERYRQSSAAGDQFYWTRD